LEAMLCITAVMRRDCPLWRIDHRPILRSQVMNGVWSISSSGGQPVIGAGMNHATGADPDAEVHAMLLDVVIAKQAAVVTTAELAGALPGRSNASDRPEEASPLPAQSLCSAL
jgi:hypothetical protein